MDAPPMARGEIGRIARSGLALVFGLLQQLQALGVGVPTVLSQLGLDEKTATPLKAVVPPAPSIEAGRDKK